MVEFVLILPVLVLLLLLIVDFGRVFSVQIAMANAAREGARYCALHPNDTAGTRARVRGDLAGRVAINQSATTCSPVVEVAGTTVTVAVNATFTPITPFVSALTGGPMTLQTAATMEVW
jgi:Flp pilus assembly protein TadG